MYEDMGIGPKDSGLLFNCDETLFSHDPKDKKIVAEEGVKRISRNIAGTGKTNTTVLAAGAADGQNFRPSLFSLENRCGSHGSHNMNTLVLAMQFRKKVGWIEIYLSSGLQNCFCHSFLPENKDEKRFSYFFMELSFILITI